MTPTQKPAAAPAVGSVAPGVFELWVDGSAAPDGDGAQGRPLRSLQQAVASEPRRPLRVHLATGLYEGPFALDGGLELVGHGVTVLHADGPAVLSSQGSTRLTGLTVQGGVVGISSEGALTLEDVKLSGQRTTAVRIEAGTLRAARLELTASVSGVVGLELSPGTAAHLVSGAFLGPFSRGVQGKAPSQLELIDTRFEGPVVGLHLVGGSASLRKCSFQGGRGPAIFAASAGLQVREVTVSGHEYALQTGPGTVLDLVGLRSQKSDRAAIALVKTSGSLNDVEIEQAGGSGGLQLLECSLTLTHLRVFGAVDAGLLVRKGRLVLRDAIFSDIRSEEGGGDALALRDAQVSLEDVTVRRVAGLGVFASAMANVELRSVSLEDCRAGGLVADRGARVQGSDVTIVRAGQASLAVPEAARIQLDQLKVVQPGGGGAWVSCGEKAQLKLTHVTSDTPAPALPCLR